MKKKKLVYICSPYKGDTETNTKNALSYCAAAFAAGYIPIAPHVYFTRWSDDNNKKERAEGMAAGKQLLLLCSEIWVFGLDKPSKGMQEEIALAIRNSIRIYDGEIRTNRHPEMNDAARAIYNDMLVSALNPAIDLLANSLTPIVNAIKAAGNLQGGKL